jgi:hypothetical protein
MSTPIERVKAMQARQQGSLAQVRVDHPEFAEWADSFRATFPGAKLIWIKLPDGTEQGESFEARMSRILGRPAVFVEPKIWTHIKVKRA